MSIAQHVQWMAQRIREMKNPLAAPPPQTPNYEEILDELSARIGYGQVMESLKSSPGYQMLRDLRERRLKEAQESLETVDANDAKSVVRLQVRIEEIKALLDEVPNAIAAGKQAQDQRATILEELGGRVA